MKYSLEQPSYIWRAWASQEPNLMLTDIMCEDKEGKLTWQRHLHITLLALGSCYNHTVQEQQVGNVNEQRKKQLAEITSGKDLARETSACGWDEDS